MADPADSDEGDDHTESSVLKDLRVKAKRTDDAEARAEKAERKLGLIEAGLGHLDEDQVNALVGSGEFDAEAAKAKAEKWGWLSQGEKPKPADDPAAVEEAAAKEAELAQLANLTKSPASPAEPLRGQAAVAKEIEDFDGDWQAFQQFVLGRADDILS